MQAVRLSLFFMRAKLTFLAGKNFMDANGFDNMGGTVLRSTPH